MESSQYIFGVFCHPHKFTHAYLKASSHSHPSPRNILLSSLRDVHFKEILVGLFFFLVWLVSFNTIFLRFIHVAFISSSFFIAKQHFIVLICHNLTVHQLMGHLDCFQFWAIVNKAAVSLCIQVLVWIYAFISLE